MSFKLRIGVKWTNNQKPENYDELLKGIMNKFSYVSSVQSKSPVASMFSETYWEGPEKLKDSVISKVRVLLEDYRKKKMLKQYSI